MEGAGRVLGVGGGHRSLRLRFDKLQKANDPSVADVDLETWAAHVRMRGEVMVAARCNSRFSDEYYGQWLLLHVPFRSAWGELWDDDVLLVPTGYRMFALCLMRRPQLWRDEAWVRGDMELEAHRGPTIESIVAMVKAHTTLVDDYFEDRLVLDRARHDVVPSARRLRGQRRVDSRHRRTRLLR